MIYTYFYKNGMTVKELKELVKDWPEYDFNGEPTTVWIETGLMLSSPVIESSLLNYREQDGKEAADLLLESNTFEEHTGE